jgi:undecaprenyl-diphosphatase
MNDRQKIRWEKIKNQAPEKDDSASGSRIGWILGLASGLVLAGGSTFVVWQSMFLELETKAFHFINSWPDSLRNVFLAATIVHESLWIPLVAVIVTFVLKIYRAAWELAAATIAGYGLIFIGKELLIARARPEGLLDNPIVRIAETGNGFPSGHTMIITVVVLVLFPYLPKVWRWLPVLLLVPAMALSRVYLGVHLPLDVVGGFAVGLTVVCAMRSLPASVRRWLKFS